MEFLQTILLLCIFFPLSFVTSKFNHVVSPSCDSSKRVCEFDFEVTYVATMVQHKTDSLAVPIVYRNGTFYRKESYSCENMTEISQEGRLDTRVERNKFQLSNLSFEQVSRKIKLS